MRPPKPQSPSLKKLKKHAFNFRRPVLSRKHSSALEGLTLCKDGESICFKLKTEKYESLAALLIDLNLHNAEENITYKDLYMISSHGKEHTLYDICTDAYRREKVKRILQGDSYNEEEQSFQEDTDDEQNSITTETNNESNSASVSQISLGDENDDCVRLDSDPGFFLDYNLSNVYLCDIPSQPSDWTSIQLCKVMAYSKLRRAFIKKVWDNNLTPEDIYHIAVDPEKYNEYFGSQNGATLIIECIGDFKDRNFERIEQRCQS